jgi:alkylation response protein AidB-like acyl-CoA dehydrogenase
MASSSPGSRSSDGTTPHPGTVDYIARARAMAPVIAAEAEEIERRRELPPSLREVLIENGLYRLLLPRSLGGAPRPTPAPHGA